MIDFLVNLALNLGPKIHQKATQEGTKIDEKGYLKYDASWLRIWNPLGTILVDFGSNLGGKLGPSSLQNLSNIDQRTILKRSPKIAS